jgi:hypothetical protein
VDHKTAIINRVLKIHSVVLLPEEIKLIYWGFVLLGAIKAEGCIPLTE